MQAGGQRSRVKRGAKRASYDWEVIRDVLDSNFLCHVGYSDEGQVRVIPTAYVRVDEAIYLHGNRRNRMLRALLDGQGHCITITELNGLVLGRSGLHHSVNYRSVVLFGRGLPVPEDAKPELLDALLDQMVPGRSNQIRPHMPQELAATLVVKFEIEDAAAKVRNGPPLDAEEDYALDTWAGVITLKTVPKSVEPCPRLPSEVPIPEHVMNYLEQFQFS